MTERQIKIRQMMDNIIAKTGFRVASLYPGDLKCDTGFIQSFGNGPAQIGWILGDTHTHIVALGIHPELNDMVHCYLKLDKSDKFFKLTLLGSEDFKLVEVEPQAFAELSNTRIPYSKISSNDREGFVLQKNGTPIVDVRFSVTGGYGNRVHVVKLKPLTTISDLDRYAGDAWAYQTLIKVAQTIFFKAEVEWEDRPNDTSNQTIVSDSTSLSLF